MVQPGSFSVEFIDDREKSLDQAEAAVEGGLVQLESAAAALARPRELGNGPEIDREVGWPPHCRWPQPMEALYPEPAIPFGDSDRERLLTVAAAHLEVARRLSGRWRPLACCLELAKADGERHGQTATATFYNYGTNELIEVTLSGETVTTIRLGHPWQHPEIGAEAAEAIQLARSHVELREAVAGLEGHAILSAPATRASRGFGHRCLHVVFTSAGECEGEKPVLFSALVDLSAQEVITYQSAPE